MFTVKFFNHFEDGSSIQTSISCENYSAYNRADGSVSITTYQNMEDVNGVERHVHDIDADPEAPKGFQCCFVENSKGKTIDRFPASRKGI